MFRRYLPMVLGACLTATALAPTAARSDAAPANQFVRDLASPRYAVRQRAHQALDRLGEAALPALARAAQSPDVEVRRRARALIASITRRAEMDKLLAATPVRLVCKDTPVPNAVAELGRQSGFVIELQGDRTPLARRKITLDTGPTTFWPALDQLCRKAGLTERGLVLAGAKGHGGLVDRDVNPSNVKLRLVLAAARPPELPTWYFKGLRLRALPPATPLDGLGNIDPNEKVLVLEASLEPRMRLHKIIDLRLDKATDERDVHVRAKAVLLSPNGFGNPYASYYDSAVPSYLARLQSGMDEGNFRRVLVRARALRRFNLLKGTLIASVQKPSESVITVDNILKAGGKSFGTPEGNGLRVDSVDRQTDGRVVVHLDTTFPLGNFIGGIQMANGIIRIRRGPNGPWEKIGVDPANLRLVDRAGRNFPAAHSRTQGTSFAPGGITQQWVLTYHPAKGQVAPDKLVYIGLRTIVVDVPFTLKNVPLP